MVGMRHDHNVRRLVVLSLDHLIGGVVGRYLIGGIAAENSRHIAEESKIVRAPLQGVNVVFVVDKGHEQRGPVAFRRSYPDRAGPSRCAAVQEYKDVLKRQT